MITFYQGEDVILELPIVEGSTTVNLSTATDFRIILFNVKNNVKTELYRYSLVQPLVNYGLARIKTGIGNEHIIQVVIKREQSTAFTTGLVKAEILVSFPDVAYPDDDAKRKNFVYESVATVLAAGTTDIAIS